MFSQRLGLPTDPYLLVQQLKPDDKGVEQAVDLQGVDDTAEVTNLVHWSMKSGLLFNTETQDPACRLRPPRPARIASWCRICPMPRRPARASVYRLSIHPPQPDFRLIAVPRSPTIVNPEQGQLNNSQGTIWSPLLRRGGTELIEVFAVRRDGFEGESASPPATCRPACRPRRWSFRP